MLPDPLRAWLERSWMRRLARQKVRSSEPLMILLCAPLGAFVGLVVVGLHALVSWLHVVAFSLPPGASLSSGVGADPLRMLVVPAAGGAALALFAALGRRLRPGGVVDPVEANALFGGRMSLRDSFRLVGATIVSNAAGASLGMEAAYSQIGSGVLSRAGQWLHLRRADLRIFVAAGAAAAIAAAFNAPLAGAFYAFELVLGSYSPAALAQIATAALAGTLTMRATVGVAPIFVVAPQSAALDAWAYPLFAAIGVAAAAIGIATMRAATTTEKLLYRLPQPRWIGPAIGGALISGIAVGFPQVLGSGHGAIQALLDDTPGILPLVLLLAAKALASAISVGSGFRGGLFSSSLYLGCLFGAAAAQAICALVPQFAAQQTAFALGSGLIST